MLGHFLERPATRADIIGWIVALPVAVWALLSIPSLAQLPSKYSSMYSEFSVRLEPLTVAALALGGGGLSAVVLVLGLTPIVVLLRSKRAATKILVPLYGALLLILFNQLLFVALIEPATRIMASFPSSDR